MSNIKVSVIIPVYNMYDDILKCLASFEKSSYKHYELIIVDDSSDENLEIRLKHKDHTIVRLDKRSGPGAARNRGVSKARGEILFFIDADVEVLEDTIEKAVGILINNPNIAAVVGDYTPIPGSKNFVSEYKNLFHTYHHNYSSKETSTFFTACSAVRKDAFLKTGGFEEGLGGAVEDIEIGYKLRLLGFRIWLQPDIQVRHNKYFTLFSLIKTDIFGRGIPWVQLILKYKSYYNDLNTDARNIISLILAYAFIASCLFSKSGSTGFFQMAGILFSFLLLNLKLFLYFFKNKGFVFFVKSIFMVFIYYLCCGISVLSGALLHIRGGKPCIK